MTKPTKEELHNVAKRLWDNAESRPYSPAWEDLGEITKEVWLRRAAVYLEDDDDQVED